MSEWGELHRQRGGVYLADFKGTLHDGIWWRERDNPARRTRWYWHNPSKTGWYVDGTLDSNPESVMFYPSMIHNPDGMTGRTFEECACPLLLDLQVAEGL